MRSAHGAAGSRADRTASPAVPLPLRIDRFVDGGSRASLAEAAERARAALGADGAREKEILARVAAVAREEQLPLESTLARAFVAGPTTPVLLTGYYEPTLRARTRRDARFRHPLHRPPDASHGAGFTRAQIESGALDGRGLELFWVDDPIELFFLHVQGSGRLELPDGRIVRVGYAASNGLPYRSIGSELVARGVFTPAEATAPAIKRWLRAHPSEVKGLLQRNARYIFFRVLDTPSDLGPPGSLGASLVPLRSVAVDPAVTQPGSVGLLLAPLPDGSEIARFVVAMDRGAAIRGPARLDLFLGPGRAAEELAGELRSSAHVAWLVPRR